RGGVRARRARRGRAGRRAARNGRRARRGAGDIRCPALRRDGRRDREDVGRGELRGRAALEVRGGGLMAASEYHELRVRFERATDGAYRVSVSGTGGEAVGTFRPPFSDLELENLVLRLGRPRGGVRRVDSPDFELVRNFGGSLFDAVFAGRVR